MIRPAFVSLAALASPWAFVPGAQASSKIYIPNCASLPCSVKVPGYVDTLGQASIPWTAVLSFDAGHCLVAARDTGDAPIMITLVSPDGTIGDVAQDFAFIRQTTVGGWYTIQVASAREQIFNLEIMAATPTDCDDPP